MPDYTCWRLQFLLYVCHRNYNAVKNAKHTSMKTNKILYWTFTGLFGAFMLFSAIPDVLVLPDAAAFITQLGYPVYLVPFLGVAKTLGVIAILVPGFPRLKEWAYAGLFYDLLGATYSALAQGGFQPAILFMLVPFTLEALSYVYFHKKQRLVHATSLNPKSPVAA
jgi:hypothetical protein